MATAACPIDWLASELGLHVSAVPEELRHDMIDICGNDCTCAWLAMNGGPGLGDQW